MASRREDLGSWLEGTPGGDADRSATRLGLPVAGPGSPARVGRRLAALSIDWLLSLAVSAAISSDADPDALPLLSGSPTVTLAVFGVSTAVLVALLGHTVGHRLLGLRVARVADLSSRTSTAARPGPDVVPPPGPAAALVRTALLCLVIPAVVWDRDGRGLHDVAARTVIVRR